MWRPDAFPWLNFTEGLKVSWVERQAQVTSRGLVKKATWLLQTCVPGWSPALTWEGVPPWGVDMPSSWGFKYERTDSLSSPPSIWQRGRSESTAGSIGEYIQPSVTSNIMFLPSELTHIALRATQQMFLSSPKVLCWLNHTQLVILRVSLLDGVCEPTSPYIDNERVMWPSEGLVKAGPLHPGYQPYDYCHTLSSHVSRWMLMVKREKV